MPPLPIDPRLPPSLSYSTSGSPHRLESVSLAQMVDQFLHSQPPFSPCGRARCNCLSGTCSGDGSCSPAADDFDDPPEQLSQILQEFTSCTSETEFLLLAQISKAILELETEEISNAVDNEGRSVDAAVWQIRRPVMRRLRQAGYNAAICKSRWNEVDGFPAGDYEYIDVVMDGTVRKPDRFIVDIDFKSQFEIARASRQYSELLNVLPKVFVGRADRLKRIIKIMSDASKRSLKKEGLHLPPWRKQRYLQAKWFSSYWRTTKEESQKPAISGKSFEEAVKEPLVDSVNEMDKRSSKPYEKTKCQKSNQILSTDEDATVVDNKSTETRFQALAQQKKFCTVMCTEWQLPAPNAKKRDMVSGLANALRESGNFPMSRLQKPLEDPKQHMVTVVS